MSIKNGVIRIGRKGLRKFAFGEDGTVFEVDVVVSFQEWIRIDGSFRQEEGPEEVRGTILASNMPEYHQSAVKFTEQLGGEEYTGKITTAEALDFIARLREQYDELASFFRPRSLEERGSSVTSGVELRFSAEES